MHARHVSACAETAPHAGPVRSHTAATDTSPYVQSSEVHLKLLCRIHVRGQWLSVRVMAALSIDLRGCDTPAAAVWGWFKLEWIGGAVGGCGIQHDAIRCGMCLDHPMKKPGRVCSRADHSRGPKECVYSWRGVGSGRSDCGLRQHTGVLLVWRGMECCM